MFLKTSSRNEAVAVMQKCTAVASLFLDPTAITAFCLNCCLLHVRGFFTSTSFLSAKTQVQTKQSNEIHPDLS